MFIHGGLNVWYGGQGPEVDVVVHLSDATDAELRAVYSNSNRTCPRERVVASAPHSQPQQRAQAVGVTRAKQVGYVGRIALS